MRKGYHSGAAGILVSSLAWGAATVAAIMASPERAVWVLFIGGALIHPVGLVVDKLLGAPGTHTKGNPMGELAGASTFWLIFSLPLAYGLSLHDINWFFPAMLLIIGGRYLVFSTIYGMRLYWVLGIALAGAGVGLGMLRATPAISAGSGALIEFALAMACFVQHRSWMSSDKSQGVRPA